MATKTMARRDAAPERDASRNVSTNHILTDARSTRLHHAQVDAQGFKKPSTGFILQVDQPLTALKNAQIEVRRSFALATRYHRERWSQPYGYSVL